MENQIYRLKDGNGYDLEFWIVPTNDLDPYKEIRELGISVTNKGFQLDFDANENELKSLIKYLEESLEYIEYFNKKSRAIKEL